MKVAIYVRVSTEKQETENQLGPLQEFAQRKGYEIAGVYKDIATGTNTDRESFKRMMSAAHQKRFEAILVWSLDRLSREGMVKTINLLEHLNNIGVGVISYTEPYLDTTNELARNILLAVLSTLAKAEREKISERTKAGLIRARREGKHIGRPGISEKQRQKILTLRARKWSLRAISQKIGVSHTAVAKALKKGVNKRDSEKPDGKPTEEKQMTMCK